MARHPLISRPRPEVYDGAQLGHLLPHLRRPDAQTVAIFGRRGMGKTFGEEAYIEVREPRLLVVTLRDDFQRVRRSESLEEALLELSWGEPCRRRVIVDRSSAEGFESLEEYGDHLFASCADSLRDALLVVSEAHLFARPPPYPPSKELVELISQGRHYGVRMMADSQRPQNFQPIFLSEGTHLVCFKLLLERDLAVVESWAGPEAVEVVAQLDKGQCVILDL